ncbi:MAG: hypothetical protein K0R52_117 [Alphaproteobacteria bacterium]|jgi:hypothetical protein|nr:hypothetical protein [Alphaproteobacteria bacterium]
MGMHKSKELKESELEVLSSLMQHAGTPPLYTTFIWMRPMHRT